MVHSEKLVAKKYKFSEKRVGGGESEAVWKFSENSSILFHAIIPYNLLHSFSNQPGRDLKLLMPFSALLWQTGWCHGVAEPYIRTAAGGNGAFGTCSEVSES